MTRVLGVNAVFHDPAAALVIDGQVVAAAEEERFSRRKHGKPCVPFSTWELPEAAARWCLAQGGLRPDELDAVAYSYEPALLGDDAVVMGDDPWEPLRTMYAARADSFLADMLPGLDRTKVVHVAHHHAHAASAYLAAPFGDCAVMVMDGRGETGSYLAGRVRDQRLEVLATQPLPHSLGLLYEELTEHLGFHRSSDEYKVMALASYGDRDRFAGRFREIVTTTPDGGFRIAAHPLEEFAPRRAADGPYEPEHADLAAAVQCRLEETVLELGRWLQGRTGDRYVALAGGVALNCVANARLAAEGPFEQVWVQPAAGDAGTALGAAAATAVALGDRVAPMTTAALGRGWSDDQIEEILRLSEIPYRRPPDVAEAAAEALASDRVVGWFEGRSEFGPRALGHRSLLVDPRRSENLQRMNAIKGREEFRPVAPMVLADRATEIFEGQLPSPYMLFVHTVRPEWRDRIPAVVHVDGTARVQTVARREEPLLARVLEGFEERTGVPVLVNTSFNTAGRPMVDHPRDALECFGSGPIDLVVLGPFTVERTRLAI